MNTVKLREYGHFTRRAWLDLDSRRLIPLPEPGHGLDYQGEFWTFADVTLLLFRHLGKLHVGSLSKLYEFSDDLLFTYERVGKLRRFAMTVGDNSLADLTYEEDPSVALLDEDPTPFISEEDFDFPLFLCNLAKDPGRRAVVFNREI